MSRIRFVFLNSIAYILLGSAVVSCMIEIVWLLVGGQKDGLAQRLVFNFFIGLLISTSLIFVQLLVIRFKKRPSIGYLLSAACVLALLFLVYLHTGLTVGIWDLDEKWLVIFLVAESLSMALLTGWYRQVELYDQKLETKKALLRAKKAQ